LGYEKIIVGLDGSELSYKALDHAIEIAGKFGAELKLVAVVPKIRIPVYGGHTRASEDIQRFHQSLGRAYSNVLIKAEQRVKFLKDNIKIEKIILEGKPSTNIVEASEEKDVDLIIIGSRGIGGITGWILGTTSNKVVETSKKPVLIIK
jgi:nucleotide-binding universal stress UspA family protein